MPDKKGAPKTEKLISRKYVFEGRALKTRVDSIIAPDGRRTTREVVERNNCVAIVAVDGEDNILLVDQYRTPIARNLLEIPAGGIEPGEDPAYTVVREMQEETGFKPAKVVRLCGGYLAPGFTDEYCHIYLAAGLTPSPLTAEDTGGITLVKMPSSAIAEAISSGRIQDAKSIAGLMYYLEWRKRQ